MFLFILFIVIILLLLFVGAYVSAGKIEPYTPPPPDYSQMSEEFVVYAPWGWDDITQPDARSAVPVDSPDGVCSSFTFISNERFQPATVNMSSLQTCSSSGCVSANCSCFPSASQCVDVDQVMGIKMMHKCMDLPEGSVLKTNGQCVTQNGALVDIGYIEEFYQTCGESSEATETTYSSQSTTTVSATNYCSGTIGLVTFGVEGSGGEEIFNNAVCLSTPHYTTTVQNNAYVYSGLTPLYQGVCDMRTSYNSIPSQLFRVQRANYDGYSLKESSTGQFARIIHRPTQYVVYPTFNETGLLVDGNYLTLVDPATITHTNGYVWLLVNQIKNEDLVAPAQIVYCSDYTTAPNINDTAGMWDYCQDKFSIQPQLATSNSYVTNGTPVMKTYFVTNSTSQSEDSQEAQDEQNKKSRTTTQYFEYSIISVMIQDPSAYTFY